MRDNTKMADRVIGIAILETASSPQKLHVLCGREGKHSLREIIEVYPAGSPKPCEPAWAYRIEGETLHVTPSLHIRVQANLPESEEWTTWFHNDGNWSVPFRAWPQTEGAWSEFRRVNGLERE